MTGAKRRDEALRPSASRLVIAAALVLLCAIPGYAQAPGYAQVPQPPGATRTVNLTLEQRHVIRELMRELKVNPAGEDLKIAAGDEVPAKVELQPVPPLIGQKVPQIKSHRIYVTKNQILIVDPQDKKVVEVIDD
jgi:Protein of unknown function (DUF1236)